VTSSTAIAATVTTYPPLFVLAPGRSYSSIVTQMLGCHPQLYAFPELRLFTSETVDQWQTAVPVDAPWSEAHVSGVLRAFAEVRFGGQTQAGVAAARRHVESLRGQPAPVLMDELLAAVAPRIGVEKSPETAMVAGALQRLLRAYPQARFIHLLRHPIATCESLLAAWMSRYEPSLGDPERWVPFSVIAARRRIMQFLHRLPADRWRVVRGEDAVDRPIETLEPVLAWLGLRTDATALDALRHPERSPFARVGPDGARSGNDPRFQRHPTLRRARRPSSPALRGDWRVSPRWRDELEALGRELGYG
jgi:Sulfotransferase family